MINLSTISDKKIIIFFALLIVLIYGNSIDNEYSLDDDLVVFNNSKIEEGIKSFKEIFTTRTLKGDKNSIYRPLPVFTFAIEKQFFNSLPKFQTLQEKSRKNKLTQANLSHFFNLVFYFLTCLVLYKLLRVFSDYNIFLPFLVVTIFLVHPLHTEPVNNLKSRDELLMLLFVLLAINQYIKFCTLGGYYRLFLAFLFFVLASFSKENAILLLGVLPVILYFIKVDFKKIAFLVTVSLIGLLFFSFIRGALLNSDGVREYLFFENPLFFTGGVLERITVGFYCSWFYLKMLIFPNHLSFYYGYNQIPMATFANWEVWLSILFFIPLGIYGLYLFYKRNVLGLGIVIWFGIMLGVVNVFFPIVGIVADRFAYVFSLGFSIVLAWLLLLIFKIDVTKEQAKIHLSPIFIISLGIILLGYSARVVARNANWENHLTLYENDIKHLNNSAKANALVANTYYPMVFEKARLNPSDPTIKNDMEKVIFHYKEAIRIDSTYLTSLNNLASVYSILLRDYKTAIYYSSKAIQIKPNYLEAQFNLGYSYDALDDYENALQHYLEVLKLNPEYNNAYIKLELLFNRFNKLDEGVFLMNNVAKNHQYPKNIYLNIANFISKKGVESLDSALFYFEKAFRADENDKVICNHIIKLYEMKGDVEKVKYYQQYVD